MFLFLLFIASITLLDGFKQLKLISFVIWKSRLLVFKGQNPNYENLPWFVHYFNISSLFRQFSWFRRFWAFLEKQGQNPSIPGGGLHGSFTKETPPPPRKKSNFLCFFRKYRFCTFRTPPPDFGFFNFRENRVPGLTIETWSKHPRLVFLRSKLHYRLNSNQVPGKPGSQWVWTLKKTLNFDFLSIISCFYRFFRSLSRAEARDILLGQHVLN